MFIRNFFIQEITILKSRWNIFHQQIIVGSTSVTAFGSEKIDAQEIKAQLSSQTYSDVAKASTH